MSLSPEFIKEVSDFQAFGLYVLNKIPREEYLRRKYGDPLPEKDCDAECGIEIPFVLVIKDK